MVPSPEDLQSGGEQISAALGRSNFATLCDVYSDIYSSYESIQSLQFLAAEVNNDHEKKKLPESMWGKI